MGRYLAGQASTRGLGYRPLEARLGDPRPPLTSSPRCIRLIPSTFIHLAARVSVPACEADPPIRTQGQRLRARGRYGPQVVDWARTAGVSHRRGLREYGTCVRSALPERDAMLRARHARDPIDIRTDEAEARSRSRVSRASWRRPPDRPGIRPDRAAAARGLCAPGLIARVRKSRIDNIPGLDFSRDYLDARDVCGALIDLALGASVPGVEVIKVCSGAPVTIRQLLAAVASASVPPVDPSVIDRAVAAAGRPDDIPWIVGDPTRLESILGRSAGRIPVATTVGEAVDASSSAGTEV